MLNARTWTASNMLSLFRVFLLLPIYQGLSQNTARGNAWALLFMSLAILSDYLDGFLARRLDQISDLGKLLDPLADKICILGVCLMLAMPARENSLPYWFLGLLLARDVALVSGGLLIYRRRNIVTASNIWGKSTSTVLALMLVSYVMKMEPTSAWFFWLNYQFLLWLSLSFMLVSSVSYVWRFFNVMSERPTVVGSSLMKTGGLGGRAGTGHEGGEN